MAKILALLITAIPWERLVKELVAIGVEKLGASPKVAISPEEAKKVQELVRAKVATLPVSLK